MDSDAAPSQNGRNDVEMLLCRLKENKQCLEMVYSEYMTEEVGEEMRLVLYGIRKEQEREPGE